MGQKEMDVELLTWTVFAFAGKSTLAHVTVRAMRHQAPDQNSDSLYLHASGSLGCKARLEAWSELLMFHTWKCLSRHCLSSLC